MEENDFYELIQLNNNEFEKRILQIKDTHNALNYIKNNSTLFELFEFKINQIANHKIEALQNTGLSEPNFECFNNEFMTFFLFKKERIALFKIGLYLQTKISQSVYSDKIDFINIDLEKIYIREVFRLTKKENPSDFTKEYFEWATKTIKPNISDYNWSTFNFCYFITLINFATEAFQNKSTQGTELEEFFNTNKYKNIDLDNLNSFIKQFKTDILYKYWTPTIKSIFSEYLPSLHFDTSRGFDVFSTSFKPAHDELNSIFLEQVFNDSFTKKNNKKKVLI